MKHFIEITIIPHKGEKPPTIIRIPLIIALVGGILITGGTILILHLLISSISSLVDVRSLEKLEDKNLALETYIAQMEKNLERLESKLEKVKEKADGITPLLREANLPVPPEPTGKDISALTKEVEKLVQDFTTLKEKAKEASSENLPSIIPVNGLLIRGFGKTYDVFTEQTREHRGITIAAPEGTPVYASGGGIVTFVGYKKRAGLTIEIKHSQGFSTIYAHCGRALVRQGMRVKRGKKVATVGKTGDTVGPALYFEVRKNGTPIDPLSVILSPTRLPEPP